ncbi:hypothetical protein SUGI_0331110 [Cryptomeria japonica]|uniref:metacaspase-9 n=1 Tax=Cryptomeria japonica TaxID=3369 RepID=UPI002408EE01|nr:metacaspase-9 [Cryptomeria japonica]GLJ18592.1 hypothetical protein SUGI_0331110 [Cryptomeria japonica]
MTSNKYAVLVGCNYPNTQNELHGCVNDVVGMKSTLLTRFGFGKENIELLIDTDESYTKPTGENIRKALLNMVGKAKGGDVLFFHYSGHGTIIPIHHHKDECIVPCDFNFLTDEDFREIVNQVPEGASFTMVSDSCHSGGLIDKEIEQIGPHGQAQTANTCEITEEERKKSKFLPLDSILQVLREKTGQAELEGDDIKTALFDLFGGNSSCKVKKQFEGVREFVAEQARVDEDMGILLSGCQSDETSADACPSGNLEEAFGAFTNAIQMVLGEHPGPISNKELVLSARKLLLRDEYSQHPCLYCSNRNADANFLFEQSNNPK